MVKVFKEAVKRPVGGKRKGNIKTAVVSDEKVVVQVIDKVGYHGEAFTLHHNKSTNHGMTGKSPASGFRVFLNKGQLEVHKKGIIKLRNRLRGKKTNVLDNFLTVDNNQLLSVN